MLKPVLNPFHGPASDARRHTHQNQVGEHTLLNAEAAAGVWRRAEPEAVAGYFEGACDHRVDAEGTLEARKDVVGILVGVVARDHPVSLEGRAGIAWVADVDPDPVGGTGKSCARVAVAE